MPTCIIWMFVALCFLNVPCIDEHDLSPVHPPILATNCPIGKCEKNSFKSKNPPTPNVTWPPFMQYNSSHKIVSIGQAVTGGSTQKQVGTNLYWRQNHLRTRSPPSWAFAVNFTLRLPQEVSSASEVVGGTGRDVGGTTKVAISWWITQSRSLVAWASSGELVVGSRAVAHHDSAITNKNIPCFPPFKSLPHLTSECDSWVKGCEDLFPISSTTHSFSFLFHCTNTLWPEHVVKLLIMQPL